MEESKCMPTPPDRVGREFVRQYFTIMNKSPENLHCFYTNEASFLHDDIDPYERRTILAEGKMAIRDAMVERSAHIQHTSTKIHLVDTNETLDNGILVQINGEISFNEQPMRPFSQTFILVPKSPFQYFVQNDMFRFTDFEFERLVLQHHSISIQTDSTEEDWGTQCEEYIEPYDEQVKQTRVNAAHGETDRTELENEVKLDTSDSGLSSDAEKAIMDIQSLNLKSILQEPRSLTKEAVMKRGPTPPSVIEGESTSNANVIPSANDMSEHCEKLFRDSCILTIGNVINPNIEFDDADHNENDKATETVDLESEMRSDDTGKAKYRKKKDKRKAKMEMAKEKVLDESTEDEKPEKLPTENVTEIEPKITDDDTSTPKSVPMEKTDKPSISASVIKKLDPSPVKKLQPSPTPKKVSFELDTPKVIPEIKTYADLAKTGKNEWVDELPAQRESAERNQAKPSSVRPPLVRRHSRTEKSTPPSGMQNPPKVDAPSGSRHSPKNDQLQVFIGNIPHSASEEGIRKMFSKFGNLTRIRLHTNPRKEWLPRYAFISYENIHAVRQCLMKKATFYWPENSPDGMKLNVNGDESIDVWDDSGNQRSGESVTRVRDLRQFSRSSMESRERSTKRSPDPDPNTNTNEPVKTDHRRTSRK